MALHLLESRAIRPRRAGGSVASVVVHALLIAGLVSATAHATVPPDTDRQEPPLTYTEVTPPKPLAHALSEPIATTTAATSEGAVPDANAPELTVPINIPSVIPEIDFSRAPTNPDDFSSGRRAQPGGNPGGIPGGTGNSANGSAYFEWQVERMAAVLPGNRGPQYPPGLRGAGIDGDVVAQFVVDTLGRAAMESFRVLRSSHADFANAVKQALPAMRFAPAEVGARKVPQIVQQAFQFRLDR
jgi:periplasmic protein TonB